MPAGISAGHATGLDKTDLEVLLSIYIFRNTDASKRTLRSFSCQDVNVDLRNTAPRC
ncbi:hypothetical protein SERLADRAFT_384872 [Serpula lacrymans var. lacrymans S7.9]|uniref:Uncharacterized protein n=1 Tax=Serpula lacrymans var. lacrymans (strain S7.9) TaxID=578457 RepID=F8NRX1_SERL9|nr:uncharacterized protein SERLADRAFT_384872 [Serpula lacrymans var. lacrymans S7.9]EGO26333.1 hypothetical protein SERLADRAFT_384872 [Serpula lacrymans var. lacrymans S7.9]